MAKFVEPQDRDQSLFGSLDQFSEHAREWQDMPEFVQEDLLPYNQIMVNFQCQADVDAFSKLINQKLTYKTKSVWFPKSERKLVAHLRYTDEVTGV